MSTAGPGAVSGNANFQPLARRGARVPLRLGCLTRLSGLLVAFGLWLVAFSFLIRPDMPTARAQIAVGAALAGVGLLLLFRMLRRVRASAVSRVELALPSGAALYPGTSVPLRVRLAGPAQVDRLVVRAICERHYSREVMAPGSATVTAENGVEELWRQDLLDERNLVAPMRAPVDRVLTFTVPTLARPTGPVMPAGTAAWRLEVASGADAMVSDAYEVLVLPSADAADAARTAPPRADRPAGPLTGSDVSTGIGCALVALAFLLVGPTFLWFYFSDVPTKRGNPVMALVAGVLFTGVGLLAIVVAVKALFEGLRQGRKGGRSASRFP